MSRKFDPIAVRHFMQKHMQREVEWYWKNGRFPLSRIAINAAGDSFVIGDASWNIKGRPVERIEQLMKLDAK